MNVFDAAARQLNRLSGRTSFWLAFLAYSIYAPIFLFAPVPFGVASLQLHAPRTKILDLEFFYTAEQAYERLASFGPQGRAAYFNILMGDLIYPALLCALLSISITLVVRRLAFAGGRWRFAALLPVANMLFDYLEDGLLLSLLASYPIQLGAVATLAGFATLMKNLFGILSFAALGLSVAVLAVRRLRRRDHSIERSGT